MTTTAVLDHRRAFEAAWADPSATRIELPRVDINEVLDARYRTDPPLRFSRDMLWDVEVRKARHPDRYIPGVVLAGSARAWGQRHHADGTETFVRSSQQRLWLQPDERGLILEQTHVDHHSRRITFIGAAELTDENGGLLRADRRQPLFHVEHSVTGQPTRPINMWRAVHLTDEPDQRLIQRFGSIGADEWLPEFVEIYIRGDLGIELSRNPDAGW
jgi:hypothetical protein